MNIKTSFRIVSCAVAFAATLYILFPLEYIRSGIGQKTSFNTINWAVHLTTWQWNSGIKYNCENVTLLGYKTSFNKIVPLIVDGLEADIAPTLSDSRVLFVSGSDYHIQAYQIYLEKAAEFNKLVVGECDFDHFSRNNSN